MESSCPSSRLISSLTGYFSSFSFHGASPLGCSSTQTYSRIGEKLRWGITPHPPTAAAIHAHLFPTGFIRVSPICSCSPATLWMLPLHAHLVSISHVISELVPLDPFFLHVLPAMQHRTLLISLTTEGCFPLLFFSSSLTFGHSSPSLGEKRPEVPPRVGTIPLL